MMRHTALAISNEPGYGLGYSVMLHKIERENHPRFSNIDVIDLELHGFQRLIEVEVMLRCPSLHALHY